MTPDRRHSHVDTGRTALDAAIAAEIDPDDRLLESRDELAITAVVDARTDRARATRAEADLATAADAARRPATAAELDPRSRRPIVAEIDPRHCLRESRDEVGISVVDARRDRAMTTRGEADLATVDDAARRPAIAAQIDLRHRTAEALRGAIASETEPRQLHEEARRAIAADLTSRRRSTEPRRHAIAAEITARHRSAEAPTRAIAAEIGSRHRGAVGSAIDLRGDASVAARRKRAA